MGLFGNRTKKKTRQKDNKIRTYDEALRTGSSIGKLITNVWNSQKNPGKAYILNRRVHHGEVGVLLGLSNLFRKSRPATAGIFSGLGEALSKDDITDQPEWFTFKKKESKKKSEMFTKGTTTTETERNNNEKANID